jgi:S1-C subfamily serine protease
MNDGLTPSAPDDGASPEPEQGLVELPATPPAPAEPRAGHRLWWGLAVAVAVLGLAVGAFFLGKAVGDGGSAVAPTTTPPATSGTIGDSEEPVADVAAALSSSVVQVETRNGLGSGVIIRSDGYILTAAHVVMGSREVTVRLADGTRLDGTLIGADANSDIAVIRVDQSALPAAATSTDIRVGQIAIAIGSPWGLDQTVTSGVVSSVARTVVGSDGAPRTMIQTDAPINPGNSGGALADRHARVIGINSAIYSSSGGSDGVGFAVPIGTALSVADRLISGEQIRTALLGVEGTDPATGPVGALITGVLPDSPADEAGLRVGDLITAFDGRVIQSFPDLGAAVRAAAPGDTVTLAISRQEEEITIRVTLGERTDD